jgi:hypothetical protein
VQCAVKWNEMCSGAVCLFGHCTALHSTAHHRPICQNSTLPIVLCDVICALHCTALHCTALHDNALHCTALHYNALHCTALHYTALHCRLHQAELGAGEEDTSPNMAICDVTAHCTALHCTALLCTALHCTALHCQCVAPGTG